MVQIISPDLISTGLQTPVSQALEQAVIKIVSALRPEKIVLFGSFAYGNPTPDSDVDLLVIINTELTHKERSWQVSKLLIPRPFPLDILVKTPEEIAQALNDRDYFVQEIISNGIILYERNK